MKAGISVSARRLLQCPIALFSLTMLCVSSGSVSHAQTAGGTVTGQILNTDTGEYVRNATVRVEGTGATAVSEDGGYYRLANVPAGEAKVVVTYTGYPTAAAVVQVTAGTAVTRNFEISSSAPSAAGVAGNTFKLERFVVSSQRAGESKALMEQRNSQDIKNVVSSEQFGDVVGGNIAEFLKNVPGIELDLDRGEATSVRLRGLPSQYTSVTLDGMSMASADANGAVAPNTRAFVHDLGNRWEAGRS